MTLLAPGSYVTVTAAPPSPNGNVATGTWFVTGQTQQGPTGVAIPITSLTDYINYCGPRVSYGILYDCLDEYFRDGGVIAYVSRVVGPGAATAAITAGDRAGSPIPTLTFSAVGAGTWGNNVSVVVANVTGIAGAYTIQVKLNGVNVGAISPNLYTPGDAVTWFASQPSYQALITVTNLGSTSPSGTNNPATGTYTLAGGSDDIAGVSETQWTNALTAFTEQYGPGQVSAPGHNASTASYTPVVNHAIAFNRIALLDAADTATAANLITQASGVQTGVTDPSYAAIFAPNIIIPGINLTNPGSASPVPNRVIPSSALAAARMAANDQNSDANVAAAGPKGQSTYAVGVTQTYVASDRALLQAAGVNVTRLKNSVVQLYGYQSLALDPNWVQLNWSRFRMQMVYDLGKISDGFVFGEIDGRGQFFAQLNGALAGKCQTYWINNSIYGATSAQAFQVNTGPQVNTAATIAAGQLIAQVLVRMSPTTSLVQINVTKYLASAPLPTL